MARNLQLARRETFFNDPFFADIMSLQDNDLHKKLDVFKQKSLLGVGKAEASHNLQVTASNDKFMVQLELPGFAPEDFSLKTKDDVIVLEAIHESNEEESTSRKYVKELKLPEGVQRDQLASSYSAEGILTISAPRVINAPEGADVKESMAAASKAYTTDDGKTAVKQDSQQASQQIATSTVSEDGTSKSSLSFSSSSSSSKTSTTSSSGGPMPSLMGDMGSMMGGGQMAVDMDMESMMAKMKGDMKLGGGSLMSGDMSKMMGSSSKMMSSSSSTMSSSSSSSSSTKMGSTMLGGGMQMPSLGNMGGIGSLDIEELSTAGTDITGPPEYTVQSPRPSVVASNVAGEMKHRVQAAADYKATDSKDADHTVLLKLKEGDEYKLVLNMQSYSPENITVKLNDDASVLTVAAAAGSGSTDDFKQTHKVPPGIDLDQMTSSFSSDGILVIKAPRKK
jgi:HSP20 family molecular chaperone IbpA